MAALAKIWQMIWRIIKPEDQLVCPMGEEETILTQDGLMKLTHESDGMALGD